MRDTLIMAAGRSLSRGECLGELLRMQLRNWRWSWPQMMATGVITPVVSILAFGVFARHGDLTALPSVLTGNLVVALMFENQNRVAANLAYMRHNGTLEYFAALPVPLTSVLAATVGAFLLLSLPAFAITLATGALLLNVALTPSLWLLPVIVLSVLPMAAVGALVAAWAGTPEASASTSVALTVVLAGLGPVVVPASMLPAPLVAAGWLNPAAYAADALRETLLGPVSGRLAVDLCVLAVLAAAGMWAAARVTLVRLRQR